MASSIWQFNHGDFTHRCPSCGRKNRIPITRVASGARCGACKSILPPIDEPIVVDRTLLDAIVSEVSVPVLIDFWAEWCGPCRAVATEVEAAAKDLAGRAVVLKVDIEKHPELASRHGVTGIPNFVVYRNGQPKAQHAGAVGRRQIVSWLEHARAA